MTKIQNLKKYHVDFRRQLKIKKMKKQLNINFIQRTLFFFLCFFNFLFVVFFAFEFQNFYFQNVFFFHDLINLYVNLSNLWIFIEHVVFTTKICTNFLFNNNFEYSKIEKKFLNVLLRLFKKIYNDSLKFKNFSKFFFFWTIFNVFVDARAKIFKNFLFLLTSLKMYCNMMFDFVHSNIRYKLIYFMNQYRFRILKTYFYKTWLSILIWYEKNLIRIIRTNQNIVINWIIKHDIIEWMFKNIVVIEFNQKSTISQSFFISRTIKKKFDRLTINNEICHAFNNNNRCEFEFCKWKHVCIKCQ